MDAVSNRGISIHIPGHSHNSSTPADTAWGVGPNPAQAERSPSYPGGVKHAVGYTLFAP